MLEQEAFFVPKLARYAVPFAQNVLQSPVFLLKYVAIVVAVAEKVADRAEVLGRVFVGSSHLLFAMVEWSSY